MSIWPRRLRYVILILVVTFLLCDVNTSMAQRTGAAKSTAAARSTKKEARKPDAPGTWRFIVSGDSRNCGDVVMPAIAAHSARYAPSFYWHLGDLRAIYKIDEDMAAEAGKAGDALTCDVYLKLAWPDFIQNQIAPFGATPFFVGIGNHERVPPKTEQRFTAQFADWLDVPVLRQQRLEDDPQDRDPRPYYHWIQDYVDFINLDNASDVISPEQLTWLEGVLKKDAASQTVRSIVVGMHEALPHSLASNHSMGDNPQKPEGLVSGEKVYHLLLAFKNTSGKPVYVLASHSHFYMEGIFDHLSADQRLPGWIVGTAGAVRYPLPKNASPKSKVDTYGYLLATVHPDGKIEFDFKQVRESDVPVGVQRRYAPAFVPWCFAHNSLHIDPNVKDANRCLEPSAH